MRSLERLPDSLIARLAGIPGSGPPLSTEEAHSLKGDLRALVGNLAEASEPARTTAVTALLGSKVKTRSSLSLVAVAVHDAPAQHAACELVAGDALQLASMVLDGAAPIEYATTLLCMKILPGLSRHFAAVVERLQDLDGPGAAPGQDAWPQEAAAAAPASAAQHDRLTGMCLLLHKLLALAVRLLQAPKVTPPQRQFLFKLALALRSSGVLEHCARAALHLHLAPAGPAVAPSRLRNLAWDVLHAQYGFGAMGTLAAGLSPAMKQGLCQALATPCTRHLALAAGLAALCAADGGSSYGLPPALLLRLPVFGQHSGSALDLRGAHGRQELSTVQLQLLTIATASDVAACAAAPAQLGPRATLALLIRLGRLAVASARAWVGAPAPQGVGADQPGRQLVLAKEQTVALGQEALVRATILVAEQQRAHLAEGAAGRAGQRQRLAEAEAEVWRLAFGLVWYGLQMGCRERDAWTLAGFIPALKLGLLPARGALPSAPPARLAGALAGGLLLCLERALRRAGRAPSARPDATYAAGFAMSRVSDAVWPLVAHALAYGEPRQAAALVMTVGKVLRASAAPELKSQGATERVRSPAEYTAILAREVLLGGAEWLEARAARGGAAAAGASPAQRQLERLLSYAVREWLPPLCDVADHCAAHTLCGHAGARTTLLRMCGADVEVRWLRIVARRAGPCGGQALAAPGAAGEGGWRRLLEDTYSVHLLGALLALVPPAHLKGAGGRRDEMASLAEACCCVAAALPWEVQAEAARSGEAGGGVRGRARSGRGGNKGASGGGGGGFDRGVARTAPAGAQLASWSVRQAQALRARSGKGTAEAMEALAAWVGGEGEEEDGAGAERAAQALARLPQIDAAARALPPDPEADARHLLRICHNPACDNLAGDSEADLALEACGRCGAAWYCRRQCAEAHRESGHAQACQAAAGVGTLAAAVGAGALAAEAEAADSNAAR